MAELMMQRGCCAVLSNFIQGPSVVLLGMIALCGDYFKFHLHSSNSKNNFSNTTTEFHLLFMNIVNNFVK